MTNINQVHSTPTAETHAGQMPATKENAGNPAVEITAQDILDSMFSVDEKVCLRVFSDRKDDGFPGAKYSIACGKFSSVTDILRTHNVQNHGVFYTVNYGGHTDEEIIRINAQFVEMDHASFEEQQKRIDVFPLPPSIIIKTRKSLHTYWLLRDGEVSRFRDIQKQLVMHFDGDPACVNESRVMRLPGFYHCKQEPVMVECILFHPERRYTQQQLAEVLPPLQSPASAETADRKTGTVKGLKIVAHECDFIRHCAENAATLSEPEWYAMITNLAYFEGGSEMIHQLSSGYPGYTEEETRKKIDHFLESGTRAMTCQTIAEKGFKCPRMLSGECSCKSPAALSAQPISIEGIRDLISELPVSGDEIQDLRTIMDFIREYLFTQDGAIAEGFINVDLKKRFMLKSATLRSLIREYNKARREARERLKTLPKSENKKLPPWYSFTGMNTLRFHPGILAGHLAKEEQVFYAAEQHYRYRNGVYRPITEKEAQKIVKDQMIPEETRMSQVEDAEMQWTLNILRQAHEINANPYIINLKNGLYDVLNDKLSPHIPTYYSTTQLNVSYTPDAACPRFRQYLEEVLALDQIPLVQEMLGYFLIPVTKAQKSFVVVGDGGSGKSQLLLVLNNILLGQENVSNVSWQALNERFKPAELFGKLANIFADLPTKNIDDNGIFKALVGEDFLTVERKRAHPFSFQNKARLLFSCNSIPRNYGDRSEGFYRRLIIIRFNRPIPEEKRDETLQEKFQEEADGIFLFALEGLKRLMRNHYRFSITESNRAELQQYREDSDSVLSFVRDCCICEENAEVGSTELFLAYKTCCEEGGLKPYSQKKFVQQLLLTCPGAEKGVNKAGTRRIIRGIRIGDLLA